jgi:GAF domain-containing protein
MADVKALIEETLYFIAQQGWKESRHDFFNALVTFLSQKLGAEYALVDELLPDGLTARTVGISVAGQVVSHIEYALKGTPCENVMGKKLCFYPCSVQKLFPEDKLLVDMGAESYAGIPLWDSKGDPIGLVAVLGKHAMEERETAEAILQLVAVRCAHELERQRDEREIRKYQEQLEQRVEERTRELQNSVQALEREIADRKRAEQERERLIADLQIALAEVKTLTGLLPICANCKKVRDDKGYWEQVEVYVQAKTDLQFTHGICPDCYAVLYPGHKRMG